MPMMSSRLSYEDFDTRQISKRMQAWLGRLVASFQSGRRLMNAAGLRGANLKAGSRAPPRVSRSVFAFLRRSLEAEATPLWTPRARLWDFGVWSSGGHVLSSLRGQLPPSLGLQQSIRIRALCCFLHLFALFPLSEVARLSKHTRLGGVGVEPQPSLSVFRRPNRRLCWLTGPGLHQSTARTYAECRDHFLGLNSWSSQRSLAGASSAWEPQVRTLDSVTLSHPVPVTR